MHSFDSKKRFLHMLPGRLRVEICGLKGDRRTAQRLIDGLSGLDGIHEVKPCPASGRMLVIFDEKSLSLGDIVGRIREVEEELLGTDSPTRSEARNKQMPEAEEVKQVVAATAEHEIPAELESFASVSVLPPDEEAQNGRIPIPLALSMGGLAVLGAKQLFMGRSGLAQSAVPFYLSAFVSIATGYPFLRRGIESFAREKRLNTDLLLGGSALALALVRENLPVLAGLSILQYVNWRRAQAGMPAHPGNIRLSPEITSYSEKASKLGIVAAGVTWALTRNPLRAIAVLLASNPRPATMSAQSAWHHGELICRERNLPLPQQGSLSELAGTKTILVEDAALLFEASVRDMQCISSGEDADRLICLAASLTEKSGHPWRAEIRQKAKETCRTIRTAFHVEEEEDGLQGKVGESRIWFGNLKYMQRYGIDCSGHLLEAKRLQRRGFEVCVLARQMNASIESLGLLVKEHALRTTSLGSELFPYLEKGWRIGILADSLKVGADRISRAGVSTDWIGMEPGEIIERIAVMRQQGENVLFIPSRESGPMNEYLSAAGVETAAPAELKRLLETIDFAETIDETVQQNYRITRGWNMIGTALATFGVLSAPIVNLAADALSLVFISRASRLGDHALPPMELYRNEAAAASEAVQWHALPWEEAVSRYDVNYEEGLCPVQIDAFRSQFGRNELAAREPTPWLLSYLRQFKEFTTLILLGTTALAFTTGGMIDGLAMGAVLLANAAISTMQERKADKVVEALNRFQPPLCKSIREGREVELCASELVPGDIVELEAGDRVPADIRLIRSWNLQVNESALTGESLPVEKQEALVEPGLPLTDRKNMLYMGTDVCGGKGLGVVVHTGMHTEMGHLMTLLKKDDKELTPLQRKVTSVSKAFMKGALLVGGVVFVTGLLRGMPVTQMITTSITLAASAIPEGLPVTITIALSAGIFRMAKKNALVRKLSALETLGRTTVICTDKTGTLTKNEMTVKTVATIDRLWAVSGSGYEPVGRIEEISDEVAAASAAEERDERTGTGEMDAELQRLVQIGVLCNNSKLERKENDWVIQGDPTEGALLSLAGKAGVWQEGLVGWSRTAEVPFDSKTAKMSVVCKDSGSGDECFVFSKGAVESILRRCSKYQSRGEVLDLSEDQKKHILSQNEALSAEALRVLAFAYRPADANQEEGGPDERDMIYVGLVGMIDPPKSEVEENIREALALGVKPVMITGDHPITAVAIGKQLGIYDGTQTLVSGHELDRLSDEDLEEVVERVTIFARVTPEHKLRIVTALQKRGHIVAMTGDGVNDTPAIKQANVGIAMGRTGTEVTKETADMILREDDFATIVEGVKEGRTILGNIRRALGCLLTGNLAEIIVTSAAVMLGLPIPLIPIQILLMNLLTDALPAMILAVNPGNTGRLTQRTDIVDRKLYQKVITKGILLGIGSLALFAGSLAAGAPMSVAQTTAFATLVIGQLVQTFSWRREGSAETTRGLAGDRFFWGALGISAVALLTAIYVPAAASFFHTAPLTLGQWLPVLLTAGSVSMLSNPILSLLQSGGIPLRSVNQAAHDTLKNAAYEEVVQ